MKKIITTFTFAMLSFLLFSQVQVGNTSDYTEIETDGTIAFHGEATVWNDYVVPIAVAKISSVQAPSWTTFLGGIDAFLFASESNAGKEDAVEFTIQLPHDWNGTAIEPHIHWSPSGNSTGNVVWGIEYTWVNYNSTSPNAFPSTITLTSTSSDISNASHKHLITGFGLVSPLVGSQDAISSILLIRFFRNSSNAADDYNEGAFALSFDIHYQSNTVGSRTQYGK